MEENILFNPGQSNQNQQTPSQIGVAKPQSGPTSAGVPPVPANQQASQPVATPPPATPPPPIKTGPPMGLILKIGIALLVLGIVGFLIFRFVLPMFGGGGKNGEATLTYWGLWESEGVMQTIIDDFEKDHPGITVEYEQRDIDKYRQTLQTRIANNDGPDIFLYHNTWTPVVQQNLSPMSTNVISPEEFESVYYPVITKDLVVKGAIYGIPAGIDTLALFVNNSIFDETGASVPKTWEDFTNVSAGVTVKDDEDLISTYGAGFGAFDNVNRAPDILSMLFAQSNVNFQNMTNSKPNIVEALRFYTDFVTGNDNIETVWNTQAPNAVVAFAGGNVAMYLGYSWDVFTIKQLNPDLNFSIYPVPRLTQPKTVASYWVNGISSKSPHQKAAQEFMKFLAQKETQEKLYTEASKTRLFGMPPARRDMAELVADNPLVEPFVSQAETATSGYFVSDTFDEGINNQMNAYLGNAVRGVIGNTSVESATDTMITGIDQVLGQYGLK